MLEFDYRLVAWPASPVEAAGLFYRDKAREIAAMLDPEDAFWRDAPPEAGTLDAAVVVFPPADHTHTAWRLAAMQSFARELAPRRINGIVGSDDSAIALTIDYLANAPGVTGQLLEVDGNSPGKG